jgi:hypothetical protein
VNAINDQSCNTSIKHVIHQSKETKILAENIIAKNRKIEKYKRNIKARGIEEKKKKKSSFWGYTIMIQVNHDDHKG